MRDSDLPSPMIGAKGHHLRRIAAGAVSYIQCSAPKFVGGIHPNAGDLRSFFTSCVTALAAYALVDTVASFIAAKSYSIAAGANQAGFAVNAGGSAGAITYTSSDPAKATVSAAGLVTPLVAGTTTITASIAATATHKAATATFVATIAA